MQPGADPCRPHAHRGQPGLLLAVVAALGVLAQLALHLAPRAVPAHRDVPPPLCARLRPQRHQPPADQPRALPQPLQRRLVHPLQVRADPQPARSAGDVIGPRASTAWRCPRGGAGCGPPQPASRAARGTGPAAPPRRARPSPSSRSRRRRKPGGSIVGGHGPGGLKKLRCTPEVQYADTSEDRLNHSISNMLYLVSGIFTRESGLGSMP